MTLSGKTNAAKLLAREYQRNGVAVVVLDILNDPEWGADFQTRSADQFLEVAKKSRQCALFIDESGESIGQYERELFWLATRARHYGHKSHFVTQRPQQLSRTVWTQCADLFLFNISEYDAKLLSDEWNQRELREAHSLKMYECFHARKMGGIKRLTMPKVPPPAPRDESLDTLGEADATYPPTGGADPHGDDPAGDEQTESRVEQ